MTTTKNGGNQWGTSTVGVQFDVQLGKMLDAARNIGEPKPYLGNRAVQWGHIDVSAARIVPMTKSDLLRYRLEPGDLLVCEGGEVGRAAIWTGELTECYFQKALHRLRPRFGYEPRVMLALLEMWAKTNKFANYTTQTSIAHLPRAKFLQMPVPLIPASEQARIAESLFNVEGLIASLELLISKKRAIKQGMLEQLLLGTVRLPGYGARWNEMELSSLLSYEQPTKFLVRSTKQLPHGRYPVLTAGKTFVLGYTNETHGVYGALPVLIFDDFTTASKFVDFEFKAKSSAMKILTARSEIADIRFVFERMQLLRFPLGDHKRYWISEYSKQSIKVPPVEEQRAIAKVAEDADAEIGALVRRLSKTNLLKEGLLRELLSGKTCLSGVVEAA